MTPGEDQFTGSIEIALEIAQPVSTSWRDAKSLRLGKTTIRIGGREETAHVEPASNDFAAITTDHAITAGHAVLRIAYSGEISRTLTDGAFAQQQANDWYIFTKFEAGRKRWSTRCRINGSVI